MYPPSWYYTEWFYCPKSPLCRAPTFVTSSRLVHTEVFFFFHCHDFKIKRFLKESEFLKQPAIQPHAPACPQDHSQQNLSRGWPSSERSAVPRPFCSREAGPGAIYSHTWTVVFLRIDLRRKVWHFVLMSHSKVRRIKVVWEGQDVWEKTHFFVDASELVSCVNIPCLAPFGAGMWVPY